MTITERLELIRAGYTKEEIAAFDAPEEEKKPEEQKPEEQKPEEQKPEEQKHEEEKKPETGNNEVLAAIAALTKAIQGQNMQKIGLDTPGKLTPEEALAQGVFGNK